MDPPAAPLDPGLELLIGAARERAAERPDRRERAATGTAAAVLVAVGIALAVVDPHARHASPWLVVGFCAGCALAGRLPFELAHVSFAPTQLVVAPMLFVLPAGLTPLVAAAGFVLSAGPALWRDPVVLRRSIVRVANAWHTVGGAAVLVALGDPRASWSIWPTLVAVIAAGCATDLLWGVVRGTALFGMRPLAAARILVPTYAVETLLALTGFCFAVAAVGAPLAGLAGLPLLGLLAGLVRERRRSVDQALALSQAYRGTAFLLGDVVASDDAYTGEHSRRVVSLSLAVAEELGVGERTRRDLEFTALLHDVGKIRIPNEIINKPGPLTAEERAVVETHTIEGERLLARVGGLLGAVGALVRSCHERWDGAGYPDRLAGEQIPLVARIVCCCDAYEAMTSDRVYAPARSYADAVAELRRCSGTQFDPRVVDALVRRLGSGS